MTDHVTPEEARQRCDEAEEAGEYGFEEEARAIVRSLAAQLEAAQKEGDDWKAACEESQASEADLLDELALAQKVIEACDRVLNWDEPRIVPSTVIPDQRAALLVARRALAAYDEQVKR